MAMDQLDGFNSESADTGARAGAERPYVGILFECCGVYARVYRRPEQPLYVGRCPKCLRTVRLRVGREGINARLFRAS
jgi:hypothetical protein